ncbi:MAG: response regulator [Halobacteriovoraceae bacterium]|nr:response regulator [Halobacteriovoraceae bacterium]
MINKGETVILLADDEPDILELMEEEFDFAGYKTLSACCGNDAIEILKKEKVDVIVSDYKMPNGNGFFILEHVKTMPEESRPLFFFVSGQADISVQEAINAGARKFFSKPFDLDDLISEIEKDIESFHSAKAS